MAAAVDESKYIPPMEGHFYDVVFFQGSPWRCRYCHNGHLLENDAPETINQDAYEAGWIFRLRLTDPGELDGLMDADSYAEHAESEDH